MFEKSAIQEQFPINEKKMWWSYFIQCLIFRMALFFPLSGLIIYTLGGMLLFEKSFYNFISTTLGMNFFITSFIINEVSLLFLLIFLSSYRYANQVMKSFDGELTEIQKKYPINNKNKLWWVHFLVRFIFDILLAAVLFLYWVAHHFFLLYFFGNTNTLTFITTNIFIFFLLALIFFIAVIYSIVSAVIDVDGFYFDVTDCEIIKKSRSAWLGGKSMLLSDIKSIKLDGLLSPFGIYRLKIKSFFNFSQMISGFDHDTAVAFKEFLDKRIEQAKHGKNN